MKELILFCIAVLLTACEVTTAGTLQQCPNLDYKPISVDLDGVTLCNEQYAVYYSEKLRTPLFVHEKLVPHKPIPRLGEFRADTRVRKSVKPASYSNTGFDRGNLAASADMATPNAQKESFLMTNVAPQAPGLNQGAWRDLENKYRDVADYAITGVIFNGEPTYLLDGAPIPAGFYKIFVRTKKCAIFFEAENKDDAKIKRVPLRGYERLTYADFQLPEKECSS